MDMIANGWFSEISSMWPGQATSVQAEEVLFHQKSKFQDALVFKSKCWGNVFCLDGCIQLSEANEAAYHETLAHIPMFCHSSPKDVLIVGGGDGGILREVLKHSSVESVTLCDLDEMVPEVSKKFFPGVSCGFSDPRTRLVVLPASDMLQETSDCYDVIIVDCSDPIGPASSIFGREFLQLCRKALRAGGVLAMQAECMWLHLDLIEQMAALFKETGFPAAEYASVQVPFYPSGGIGYLLCDLSGRSCKTPVRKIPPELLSSLAVYDEELHSAAFVVPRFVKARLNC